MATFNNHLALSKPKKPSLGTTPLTKLKRKLGLKGMGTPKTNRASGSTFRKSGSIKSMPVLKMPKPKSS